MDLPTNFSSPPSEEPHRYLRNLCIAFKKLIKETQDPEEIMQEMESLFDVAKQMNWHAGNSALGKLYRECKRYAADLGSEAANPQNVLDALKELEQLIASFDVT
jgi:hypothetical protein